MFKHSDFLIWTSPVLCKFVGYSKAVTVHPLFFVGAYFVAFSKKKKKKKKNSGVRESGGGVNKWNRGFDASLTYYVTCKATIVEVHTT